MKVFNVFLLLFKMEKYEKVRVIINEYHLQKHVYNKIKRDLYENFSMFSFTYDEIIKFTDIAEWKELEALTEFLDDAFKDAGNNMCGGHTELGNVGSGSKDHLGETEPPASSRYDTQSHIDRDRQAAQQEMLGDVDFSDNEDDETIQEFRELMICETEQKQNPPVSPMKLPIRKYRQRRISQLKPLEKVKDYSLLEYQSCIKYSISDAFNATGRVLEIVANNDIARPNATDDHLKHSNIPLSIQQEAIDSTPLDSLKLPQTKQTDSGIPTTTDHIMPYSSTGKTQEFSEPQSSNMPPIMHNTDQIILEDNLPTGKLTIPEENIQKQTKNWDEVIRNMKRIMYHNTDAPIPRKKRRKAIIPNQPLNEPNILQNGEPISNIGEIIDEHMSNTQRVPITNLLQSMEQCLVVAKDQNSTATINDQGKDQFEQQFEMWTKYIADMDSSDILNEYPRYEINLKEFITMGKELCEILKNVLQRDSVDIGKLLSRNLKKATAVKRIKALLELKTRAILSFETTDTNITHVKFDDSMEN